MNTTLKHLLAAGVVLAIPGFAMAEMSATTVNDMTVYAGPGDEYPAVGMATRGSPAILDGCMDGSKWCRIDVNGMRGWVFAEYLSVDRDGQPLIIEQHRDDLGVPVVTYEQTGAIQPSPDDELIGTVEDVSPPDTVRTYIDANPGDAVVIDQEVTLGGTLPDTVVVRKIPDYQYEYVRINDRPMLVDPATRRVVHIYE